MDRIGVLAEAERDAHGYTYVVRVACWFDEGPHLAKIECTIDGAMLDIMAISPEKFLIECERDAMERIMAEIESRGATPVFSEAQWYRDIWELRRYDATV